MPRRIRTVAFQAATDDATGGTDKFFDRVIKYIPADVVGGWVAAMGIITTLQEDDPNRATVLWITLAAGVFLTAAWTHVQTKEPGKPPAILQIIVATFAFVVWAFALGGPFAELPWYERAYGSLVLIFFTLSAGLLVPKT